MKKLISGLLVMIILTSMIMSTSIPVSADSLYVRKVVSIVYDDSASMWSGNSLKWAYANYAVQSFCGLLNKEDQLYLTYMYEAEMNPGKEPIKIELGPADRQNSVDTIRTHKDSRNTPYNAIDIAFNKLKNVEDSNVNTQYWLVVITDGEFQKDDRSNTSVTSDELTDKLHGYCDKNVTMPNGSGVQISYLAIGKNVPQPKELPGRLSVFEAENADQIIDTMSKIADEISGRSPVSDVKEIDPKTLEISTTVPLSNIAILAQNTEAEKIESASNAENYLTVEKPTKIRYPEISNRKTDKTLSGSTFLINNGEKNIPVGTYRIQFDKAVKASDVVVLFEPALEMRMAFTVNGKELSNPKELNNLMEGDKISISGKVYEMGTDTEIHPSVMPKGTKFEIFVKENGNIVEQFSGEEMLLSDYVLKNINTELLAAVTIEGFNPIDAKVEFTPTKYVPKIFYRITSGYISDVINVKLDDIASNKDLAICFTVETMTEGTNEWKPIENLNTVKSLHPVISVSPQGNDGEVTYSDDGRIIFTPNIANAGGLKDGSFDVEVTCTLDDGTTATQKYTVLISSYAVYSQGATGTIKKTELYNNNTSVSFYITKDDVKLDKEAVEKGISIVLNEARSDLKTIVDVSDDGTITVTPYSEKQHKLTFWNWGVNWIHYLFGLKGTDITVTLNHAYGSAESTIDVVHEDVGYLFVNVALPLFIEIVIVTIFIIWIILVVNKPRYDENAVLYVGSIIYNMSNNTHILRSFTPTRLKEFNRIKKGNGRLKFKRDADVISVNAVKIRADYCSGIICENSIPWYVGSVQAHRTELRQLTNTPYALEQYFSHHNDLAITEFATNRTIDSDDSRTMSPADTRNAKYTVVNAVVTTIDRGDGVKRKVIKSGTICIYTI